MKISVPLTTKQLNLYFFGENGDPGWIDADVDCNGVVNVLDKVVVRDQFGETGCSCPLFP